MYLSLAVWGESENSGSGYRGTQKCKKQNKTKNNGNDAGASESCQTAINSGNLQVTDKSGRLVSQQVQAPGGLG